MGAVEPLVGVRSDSSMVDEYISGMGETGRMEEVQIPLWSMNTSEIVDTKVGYFMFRFLYGR